MTRMVIVARSFVATRVAVVLAVFALVAWAAADVASVRAVDGEEAPSHASTLANRRWSVPQIVSDYAGRTTERCPTIAGDALGTLYASWLDERDGGAGPTLFGAWLASGAQRWSANERVSSVSEGRQYDCPAMTVDSFGARHVVWQAFVAGDPEVLHSMRRPTDTGWSAPKRVNDEPGRHAQWMPRIAADRAGNVHVVWVDFTDGTADIRHRRRNADGTWRPSVRINAEARGEQSEPALAETPGGEIVAVWRDSRDGANQIFASRLPQFGNAWWPNAELSVGSGVQNHRLPAVASDGRGGVHAVWIDAGTSPISLRAASLRLHDPGNPFWAPDRLVYLPERGDVLSAAIAGGAGGQTMVVWSESRPGTSRIYAAPLGDAGELRPERVDEGRAADAGRHPSIAIDNAARAYVMWDGTDRMGQRRVFQASALLEPPAYAMQEAAGWLYYVGRAPNCGGDAFVVVGCDGSASRAVLSRDIDLASWTGKYVIVRGDDVGDTACRHLSATEVVREIAPCDRTSGLITGLLTSNGVPHEGAVVQLGEARARTGASGRFFLHGVVPGTHVLTATARCALAAVSAPVQVGLDRVTVVPTGALVRADATEDGVVDARDLVLVAAAQRATAAQRPYCADLDRDNTVSIYDLAQVSVHYGRRAPLDWAASATEAASAVARDRVAAESRQRALLPHVQR